MMVRNLLPKWIDTKFGAIVQNSGNNPLFDSSDRVARILYRFSAYRRLSWHMLRRGVPAREILRTQFPLIEPNPHVPALVTVEFTNYCNLGCVYCTSPLGLLPRGFMQRETFERLLEGIKHLGVNRVRVIGNGECTLHPEFTSFIRELGRSVPYVSVLTNGQWKCPEDIINAVLEAPVRMVEVSVAGSDKEGYEKSRLGGHFERLLENLTLLRMSKRRLRSHTITNIRLMLRPSERVAERELMAFWSNYADTVMPQYLVVKKTLAYKEDVYMPVEFHDQSYPKCSLPFKALDVNWNGNVPLCSLSAQQIGGLGLILGNVMTDMLGDIWNGNVMRQYREGHYRRDASKMPICKGCRGI
jgi:MoaA/NifB/PqqE/SkfB family radical SAM enzyme